MFSARITSVFGTFLLLALTCVVVQGTNCLCGDDCTCDIELTENTPAGTVILDPNVDYPSGSTFHYSPAVLQTGPFNMFFTHGDDSVLTVSGNFDREAMVAALQKHAFDPVVFSFTLVAYKSVHDIFSDKYRIHILDIDDNVPEFAIEHKVLEYFEHDSNKKPLELAVDDDQAENGTWQYYLETDDPETEALFYLEVDTVPGNSHIFSLLQLVVNGTLDREERANYSLRLVAEEGNSNPDRAVQEVSVIVLDKCDKYPTFVMTRYEATVMENTTVGQLIVKVEAVDLDVGSYGKFDYEIDRLCAVNPLDPQQTCVSGDIYPTDGSKPFTLDAESGELTLNSELDYETATRIIVDIKAVDGCDKTGTTIVTINIVNINDEKPEISTSILGSGNIAENIGVNSSLAIIRIRDADSDITSVQLVDNSTGMESDTFKLIVNDISYNLGLKRSLDYEERKNHTLTVIATDSGFPVITGYYSFTINVLDVNDNPPIFQTPHSPPSVFENSADDAFVTDVLALDADSGDNARVSYTIPGKNSTFPFQDRFGIVEDMGKILVMGHLDREEREVVPLLVSANDNPPVAEDIMYAYLVLNITLLDVNDNRPSFVEPTSPIVVPENSPTGFEVVQLEATDADKGSELTFSLVTGNVPFAVSEGGLVTVSGEIDFEVDPSYEVTVEVSDGVDPPASLDFTIDISNVNERPTFGHMGHLETTVVEEQPEGVSVANITAIDVDSNDLHFTIVSGNDNSAFYLETDGHLLTARKLDRDESDDSNYTLFIQVSDGEFTAEESLTIFIFVADINDVVPTFVGAPYNFSVFEDMPLGTFVGQVVVMDVDADAFSDVEFSIIEGDGEPYFRIDPENGEISTKGVLKREVLKENGDYEIIDKYYLNVRVKDNPHGAHDNHSNYESTVVSIQVKNVNNKGPMFASDSEDLNLDEDLIFGDVVYEATAYDPDSNSVTRYAIQNAMDVENFIIDSESGVVKLQQQLDHETSNFTSFTIIAYDDEFTDRLDLLLVNVYIQDKPDHPLMWIGFTSSIIYITENTGANYTILENLKASGIDGSFIGELRYSLTNEDGSVSGEFYFIENVLDGTISIQTKVNLDREVRDEYILNITAKPFNDNGEIRTLSSLLTIKVEDENDEEPTFTKQRYDFSISEDVAMQGAYVGTVEANDNDLDENGTVVYYILQGSKFSIDPSNGVITVEQALDHDTVPIEELTVFARDNGLELVRMSSSVTVTIAVTDVNDNSPQFTSATSFSVPENQQVNTVVGQVTAVDIDSPPNGGIVSLSVSQLDPHFELTETGSLVLLSPLDREEEDRYTFTVVATDGGSPSMTNDEQFSIIVTDYNDHPPVFLNTTLQVMIKENFPVGVPFTTVLAHDMDINKAATVRYMLLDESLKWIFCISHSLGTIEVCNPGLNFDPSLPVIDYERQTEYEVGIVAYDQGDPTLFSKEVLTVNIDNVNEYIPLFDKTDVVTCVSELLKPHGVVASLRAYDWDYDALEYAITTQEPDLNHFYWDDENLSIKSEHPLDYEQVSLYFIELEVREKNTDPSQSTKTTLEVCVINENDEEPTFEETTISVLVSEETEMGKFVARVNATDADNDTSNAVSYYISSGNEYGKFRIDQDTGEIFVNGELDYDTISSFTLTVIANDTGFPQLTSTVPATVSVSLINMNDEMPNFELSSFDFTLNENSPPGTLVGKINAIDDDVGEFGELLYSLFHQSDYFEVVTTSDNSADIRSITAIDHEMLDTNPIAFTVTVTDGKSDDFVTVRVTILDADDNPPVFSQHLYTIYVSLTQPVEDSFAVLSASDSDEGSNAEHSFFITSPPIGVDVSLSPSSGELSLLQPIPAQYNAFYDFVVEVVDAGDSSLTDQATIHMVVETDSDHDPRFTMSSYIIEVPEDTSPGTTVLQLEATDADGDNLTYTFSTQYAEFSIDENDIILANPLDYEVTDYFQLSVLVVDSSVLSRTASTTVEVFVENVNDVNPVFVEPPTSQSITISEVPFLNVKLFTVQAVDSENGLEGYSLNDSSAFFHIDPSTGVITNQGILEATVTPYTFVVSALDTAIPPLVSNITLSVSVEDFSDSSPNFIDGSTKIMVPEDTAEGTEIRQFNTYSPPADSYHIVFSNFTESLFSLNAVDGTLWLESSLDYKKASQYTFIIEARQTIESELVPKRHSTFLMVDILIIDKNDNFPVFNPLGVQNLYENVAVGYSVCFVEATDEDSGTNGQVMYEIVSGNLGGAFSINQSSGEVTVKGTIDREYLSSYTLLIRARDKAGTQPKENITTLHIVVMDRNDNPPVFVQGNQTIGVYEDVEVESTVFLMQAFDDDTGPPLTHYLEVVEARLGTDQVAFDPTTFFIVHSTGLITLKISLDRETISSYLLLISADDGQTLAMAYLHIDVLDVNEHAPVFNAPYYSLSMWELLPVGSIVTDEVMATDQDAGSNAVLWYRLEDEKPRYAGKFDIDALTGVIRIRDTVIHPSIEDPDEETYTATIIVEDRGTPPLSASASLSVKVEDVNDHAPVFEESSYYIKVEETTDADTIIEEFEITDADIKSNIITYFTIPQYYSARKYFTLYSNQLLVTRALDVGNYSFQVVAINDRPLPSAPNFLQTTYVDVTVEVTPVNVYKPVFSKASYSGDVREDTEVGTSINVGISASDMDGDSVRFYVDMMDQMELPFDIDEVSGSLVLRSPLDYDNGQTLYVFKISVVDSGFPQKSDETEVVVSVLDANDNLPNFSQTIYKASVRENSPADTYLLSVAANDLDTGSWGEVSYQLQYGGSLPFRLDNSSGELFTTEVFDFEDKQEYDFDVIALDGGSPPMYSVASVHIDILDENEYTPQFEKEQYHFTAPPDVTKGSVIGVVRAYDGDGSGNSSLRYSFGNDKPMSYFEIGNTTGEIVLIVGRNRRQANEDYFAITAVVVVQDGDRTQSVNVTIELPESFILPNDTIASTAVPTSTPPPPPPPPPPPIVIIIAAALAVILVIFFIVVVVVVSLIVRKRRTSKRSKIADRDHQSGGGVELQQFSSHNSSCNSALVRQTSLTNASSSSKPPEQNTITHSVSGTNSSSSQRSYGGYADDELDSVNGEVVYRSPNMPKKHPLHGVHHHPSRSTSDLASSVATDVLTQDAGPYTKAQLEAIYAANADLLKNDDSQSSVHMFGSEGGGEADGDLDIDHMMLAKYDLEESDDLPEDDGSYVPKDCRSMTTVSLDVPPVEDGEELYPFHETKDWMPKTGSLMEAVSSNYHYAGDRGSRRHAYGSGVHSTSFEASQGMSLYGASSQGSHCSLLQHPQQQKHFDDRRYSAHLSQQQQQRQQQQQQQLSGSSSGGGGGGVSGIGYYHHSGLPAEVSLSQAQHTPHSQRSHRYSSSGMLMEGAVGGGVVGGGGGGGGGGLHLHHHHQVVGGGYSNPPSLVGGGPAGGSVVGGGGYPLHHDPVPGGGGRMQQQQLHHHLSQELASRGEYPPHAAAVASGPHHSSQSVQPQRLYHHHHPHSSMATPTTDGTVTPNTALSVPDYPPYYSSSTSLASSSTNHLQLSQPQFSRNRPY